MRIIAREPALEGGAEDDWVEVLPEVVRYRVVARYELVQMPPAPPGYVVLEQRVNPSNGPGTPDYLETGRAWPLVSFALANVTWRVRVKPPHERRDIDRETLELEEYSETNVPVHVVAAETGIAVAEQLSRTGLVRCEYVGVLR